jgi:hypothetical protein
MSTGESFAIDYTVSDNGGSDLKQVELWRKDEQSDWQEIHLNFVRQKNSGYAKFFASPFYK